MTAMLFIEAVVWGTMVALTLYAICWSINYNNEGK